MRFFLNNLFIIPWFAIGCLSIVLTGFFTTNAYALNNFEEDKCKVIKEKACVDYGERMIDGIPATECWLHEQKSLCISKEKNHCSSLESNRGCNEFSANCLEKNEDLDLCTNLEKKFACGKKLEEKAAQQEIKHIDTEFHVIRDEKDLSACRAEEINQYCEVIDDICIEAKETRNIEGKDVYKDCWKWKKQHACRSDNFIDECKDLDKNCQLTESKECLHSLKIKNIDTCDHWERRYICKDQIKRQRECIATKFCLGGICETKQRTQHNDFAEGISNLSILASMKGSDELEGCKCPNGKKTCEASEMDPSDCRLFTGNSKQCTKFPQLNCCSNKGMLRSLIGCSQAEKELFGNRKAGLCHHIATWRGKRLDRLKKYQSHCCFKSKLAKIIQVQGRRQLGIGWRDRKNPDCRALTLEEIRKIDFSKLDFSEMFADIEQKVSSKIGDSQQRMQEAMKNTKSNPAAMSELINKKIKKFYGDVK